MDANIALPFIPFLDVWEAMPMLLGLLRVICLFLRGPKGRVALQSA